MENLYQVQIDSLEKECNELLESYMEADNEEVKDEIRKKIMTKKWEINDLRM